MYHDSFAWSNATFSLLLRSTPPFVAFAHSATLSSRLHRVALALAFAFRQSFFHSFERRALFI